MGSRNEQASEIPLSDFLTCKFSKDKVLIFLPGADPGFGQGGAPASEPDSCHLFQNLKQLRLRSTPSSLKCVKLRLKTKISR